MSISSNYTENSPIHRSFLNDCCFTRLQFDQSSRVKGSRWWSSLPQLAVVKTRKLVSPLCDILSLGEDYGAALDKLNPFPRPAEKFVSSGFRWKRIHVERLPPLLVILNLRSLLVSGTRGIPDPNYHCVARLVSSIISCSCRNFEAGMKCVQTYTFDCMQEKQREHFNSLYAGTNNVVMELCQDGPYQDSKSNNRIPLFHIAERWL